MPELPEVETVRRGLAPLLEGATIERVELRRPDLRRPFPAGFAAQLAGQTIMAVGRRAKYLTIELDDGNVLLVHLGMSGSLRVVSERASATPGDFHWPRAKDVAHDHVILHLRSGARVIYNDPRRFGLMDVVAKADLPTSRHFAGLGLEPLAEEFDGRRLAGLFAGRRAPLKAALLDQRLIAGLGNIYASEALWRARLSPARAAGSIAGRTGGATKASHSLAAAVRSVLEAAIQAGGSTLRDHVRADGSLGRFQHSFAVYGREGDPCAHPGCRGVVMRSVQSGRSTFSCSACQR